MKGLLIKDFNLLKTQSRFFITIIIMVVLLTFATENPSFALGYMTFVLPMFASSTVSYDEFDNGNAFLFTLPITRKIYVFEKYVFTALLGVIACAAGIILSIAAAEFGDSLFDIKDTLISAPIILVLMLMIQCVMLPMQLKFGADKSRIALLGLGVGAIGVGYLAVKLAESVGIDLGSLLSSIERLDARIIVGVIIVFVIVVYYASIAISISIMNNKEF